MYKEVEWILIVDYSVIRVSIIFWNPLVTIFSILFLSRVHTQRFTQQISPDLSLSFACVHFFFLSFFFLAQTAIYYFHSLSCACTQIYTHTILPASLLFMCKLKHNYTLLPPLTCFFYSFLPLSLLLPRPHMHTRNNSHTCFHLTPKTYTHFLFFVSFVFVDLTHYSLYRLSISFFCAL